MTIEIEKNQVFNPIKVSFIIESQQELDALIDLHCLNISIPELVNQEHKKIVNYYIEKMHNELLKQR